MLRIVALRIAFYVMTTSFFVNVMFMRNMDVTDLPVRFYGLLCRKLLTG